MSEPVLLVDREEPIAIVTLNRPDQRNALNAELRIAIGDTMAELEADPAIRAVIVTGAGRSFCAGMDLKDCLLYTSPSPRDKRQSRMPSSA